MGGWWGLGLIAVDCGWGGKKKGEGEGSAAGGGGGGVCVVARCWLMVVERWWMIWG